MNISGTTQVVAIIGHPVEHSRSPAMHNAAFAALGLDYVYVALRVRSTELRRAVTGIRGLRLAGLNVTVPHKQRIIPLLDRVTPTARAIGAVNTVYWKGNALCGDNTDAEGFRLALDGLGFRPRGKSVIVLGAGGSARAVVWALARGGIRRLRILNRTQARARSLGAFAKRGTKLDVGPLRDALDRKKLAGADLIINCTSLGLDGRSQPPLAIEATPPGCLIYDLVYGEGPTPLVEAARRLGRRAEDGRSMLLHQAALAFRLWTGRRPPVEVMAAALRAP